LYLAGVLDVSAGNNIETFGRKKDMIVPPEFNVNGDSLPLLVALIAVASQPKFAIRTGERTYRTARDKVTFIHPSSVNFRRREISESETASPEKQIIAFAEKRQNISIATPGTPQKFLVTTTRLDPMSYMLFGAFSIKVTDRGLECDDWLPIVGNMGALDQISLLKDAMDLCMLRVFEGIIMARRNRHGQVIVPRHEDREDESEDDEDNRRRDHSLTATEIVELDVFTRDIVRILNRYSDERIASQSRSNSRPATPIDSPFFGLARLPRSGRSTPQNIGSTYNSRPGTPSRLRPS